MRFGKRVTGLLLVACLAVGMTPTMAFAEETESKPAIMLGTSGIGNPTPPQNENSPWTGSYVYFGIYNSSPVKYRVLDNETTVFGGKTMLLDCESILWTGDGSNGCSDSRFDKDGKANEGASKANEWAYSDIKRFLNSEQGGSEGSAYDYSLTGFLTKSFSKTEQNAIAESTKDNKSDKDGDGADSFDWEPLNGEKIFLLDAKEATNTSYGYGNTYGDSENRKKAGGSLWWLRSSYSSSQYVGVVSRYVESQIGPDEYAIKRYGRLIASDANSTNVGVSPALNIDLSSVLFSSKADDASKTSVLSNSSSKIAETQVTEWKLTLKDSGKSVSITDGNSVTRKSDGTIMVPYTYSDNSTSSNETVNQISIMITDKAYNADGAKILYYGKLDTTLSTSGEGTFTLPEELKNQTLGASYHLYILAEHVSGESKTDYASAPLEITSITDVTDTPVTPDTDDSNNSSSNTDTGSTSTETSTTETVEPAPITITYTVKKDDYMRKIAREHGITLEQLIALNPQVKNPNLIYAGQVLVISTTGSTVSTAEITATKTYTVLRGDSLYKIARKNGMTLAELKSLNENLFAQKYIYAGQQVLLK